MTSVSAGTHYKPRLTRLLRAIGLDIVYTRGEGSFLFYRGENDREERILDFAGGYGSLLLGHNHPSLVAKAVALLSAGRPVHTQGSRHDYAERLAALLSQRAGDDFVVHFANSGTEAVEAALKHAMLETGSRRFIALEGSFHGQTLGALQTTGSAYYRRPFGIGGLDVVRVRPNDMASLEAAFANDVTAAGFIFEPILGEGGVRPLSPAFAQRAAELCAMSRVPLIADECQTGAGRTGRFLAAEWLGVRPDYIVLSKALGGGLVKIAATLIARARYVDEFDLLHTSTYAGDDHSCAVALEALRLIDEEALASCASKGARLQAALLDLQQRFPDVIADVRGRGLMIGVEFRSLNDSPSVFLRLLSAQEDLSFLIAGYLLKTHRIRVMPTLGSARTLRLEPSLLTLDADLDRVVDGLEDVCVRLRTHDAVAFTDVVREVEESIAREPSGATRVFAYRERDLAAPSNAPEATEPRRVAWLFHLVDGDDLGRLDGQFADITTARCEETLSHLASLASPIVMSAVDVTSPLGSKVRLFPVLLPFTSRWVKGAIDARRLSLPRTLVQRGVDVAHALGCRVVSLGQYTSIATGDGRRLSDRGMSLTTGNGFSVALAIQAIERAHAVRGTDSRELSLAVVGAAGNIGRMCATLLGPRYRRVVLVGSDRPGSIRRLRQVAATIPGATATVGRAALGDADVVVLAVNDVTAPFASGDFRRSAIVCDLSIPSGVDAGVASVRPDLDIIAGGIAELPFREDLRIDGFRLPTGQVYGCLAEAILLGLEGVESSFTGALTVDHIERMAALANRHGFDLADVGVPQESAARLLST